MVTKKGWVPWTWQWNTGSGMTWSSHKWTEAPIHTEQPISSWGVNLLRNLFADHCRDKASQLGDWLNAYHVTFKVMQIRPG
jgi:hypothetical protein